MIYLIRLLCREPTEAVANTAQAHLEMNTVNTNSSNVLLLNFNFIIQEGKLALNTRKKYEVQVGAKWTSTS